MRKESKKITTDEIIEKVRKKESIEIQDIDYIDIADYRWELRRDIERTGISLTRFAQECYIQPSHLSEFLNGKKSLNRDKFLAILITLRYDFDTMQKWLIAFGFPSLYPRHPRDLVILKCLSENMNLDGIDLELVENGLESII